MIVNWEEILDSRLFVEALLIFLLPPVVASFQGVFWIEHPLASLLIVHNPM